MIQKIIYIKPTYYYQNPPSLQAFYKISPPVSEQLLNF